MTFRQALREARNLGWRSWFKAGLGLALTSLSITFHGERLARHRRLFFYPFDRPFAQFVREERSGRPS